MSVWGRFQSVLLAKYGCFLAQISDELGGNLPTWRPRARPPPSSPGLKVWIVNGPIESEIAVAPLQCRGITRHALGMTLTTHARPPLALPPPPLSLPPTRTACHPPCAGSPSSSFASPKREKRHVLGALEGKALPRHSLPSLENGSGIEKVDGELSSTHSKPFQVASPEKRWSRQQSEKESQVCVGALASRCN